MVHLLLQNGANPAALNDAGQVPIDNALDHTAIGALFQQHSAAADSSAADSSQYDASAAAIGANPEAQEVPSHMLQDMSLSEP